MQRQPAEEGTETAQKSKGSPGGSKQSLKAWGTNTRFGGSVRPRALHETHHGTCTEPYVQPRLAGPANCPEMVVLPGTRLASSLPACPQLTTLQEGLDLLSKALGEPSGFLLHSC